MLTKRNQRPCEDFRLVINKINGNTYGDPCLFNLVQNLIKSFLKIRFEKVPRDQNKHDDALVILASKVDVSDKEVNMNNEENFT